VREGQARKGKENEKRAFKKGRPRFVVFIMCEEEAWGGASSCMVKMEGERRESGDGEALSDENEMMTFALSPSRCYSLLALTLSN
jgi:hypothetical protein